MVNCLSNPSSLQGCYGSIINARANRKLSSNATGIRTNNVQLVVLGNVSGIGNLILFVALFTFFSAIFAVQLFRGEIPQKDGDSYTAVTFFTIYNSFLGMYQILSSENWTAILYNVTSQGVGYNTAWIGATFIIIWFILANCEQFWS